MFQIEIKHQAFLMTKDAYEWYEKQKPGLGEDFFLELDICYHKLKNNPTFYSRIKDDFRQLKLKHFPYVLFMRFSEKE